MLGIIFVGDWLRDVLDPRMTEEKDEIRRFAVRHKSSIEVGISVMCVLVTGAAGFIGINIVRRLAETGVEVLALTRRAPDPATLRYLLPLRNVRFAEADIRDRPTIVELIGTQRVRRVVHAAAITSAELELSDPAGFVDTNLGGTLNLLEAARIHQLERVVLVSSSGVYGAPEDREHSLRESDALQIDNLYTVCKQAAEHLCRRYSVLFGCSALAGRLGTAYGPMERPTGSRHVMSPLYRLVAAARAGREVSIYGADRLRDACYVADVADAFARLTLADTPLHAVYNVSSGSAFPLGEIAATLQELVPGWSWRRASEAGAADVAVRASGERGPMDISRLREIGFVPRYGLREGLQSYLDWLGRNNER